MKRLKQLLDEEHSKIQKDLITKEILQGNIPLNELIKVVKSNDGIYAQRGAYVITGIHDENPLILKPFLKDLWESIQPKSHDAIPRAIYRLFANIDLTEELEGKVFNDAVKTFMNKKTPIAIKAHIMITLTNVAIKYPELKDEVIFLIKGQLPKSSAGYQSTAKKELKRLGVKI